MPIMTSAKSHKTEDAWNYAQRSNDKPVLPSAERMAYLKQNNPSRNGDHTRQTTEEVVK